jgi:LmbE family N-acetylglucosaminyl deacetylase
MSFSPPEAPGASEHPVLVLSPHPDDAILGCWSVLDQADRPVTVVNVFAGIPPAGTAGGWDRECGIPDSAEMMRRRRAEDEAALGALGLTPAHLDFLDLQYTEEDRDIATIATVVDQIVPRRSAVYGPAAAGGFTRLLGMFDTTLDPHPDHQAVREVALRLQRPGVPTYLYAEIPYASGDARGGSWPEAVRRFTPTLEATVGKPLGLVVHEHTAESVARRIAAVARYATQLDRLQDGVGRFADEPKLLRYEVCWRLPPTDTALDRHRPTPRR